MAARRRALVASLVAVALAGCASVAAVRLERSGTAALDRGDVARAIADLERATTLAPGVSGLHNNLGIAYEQAGRRDDALRSYERAVELDCGNQAAVANLAALRAGVSASEPSDEASR